MSGEARKTDVRISDMETFAFTDENNDNFQLDSVNQCWHSQHKGSPKSNNFQDEVGQRHETIIMINFSCLL